MRIAMVGRRYELFKIIKPYFVYKNGKTTISENAPEEVKKAFEEYINLPLEPEEQFIGTLEISKNEKNPPNRKNLFIDDNETPEDIRLDLPDDEIDRLYDEIFNKKES